MTSLDAGTSPIFLSLGADTYWGKEAVVGLWPRKLPRYKYINIRKQNNLCSIIDDSLTSDFI